MQYKDDYISLLHQISKVGGDPSVMNLHVENDKFVDERIEFGYIIYHLERKRMDRNIDAIQESISVEMDKLYNLGIEKGRWEVMDEITKGRCK